MEANHSAYQGPLVEGILAVVICYNTTTKTSSELAHSTTTIPITTPDSQLDIACVKVSLSSGEN